MDEAAGITRALKALDGFNEEPCGKLQFDVEALLESNLSGSATAKQHFHYLKKSLQEKLSICLCCPGEMTRPFFTSSQHCPHSHRTPKS